MEKKNPYLFRPLECLPSLTTATAIGQTHNLPDISDIRGVEMIFHNSEVEHHTLLPVVRTSWSHLSIPREMDTLLPHPSYF